MKRSGRFVAAARKNESKKLLWLGVMIAAPSLGDVLLALDAEPPPDAHERHRHRS